MGPVWIMLQAPRRLGNDNDRCPSHLGDQNRRMSSIRVWLDSLAWRPT